MNWAGYVPERQLPAGHESDSEEESDREVSGKHQGQHVPPSPTQPSDPHLQPELQAVILYRHLAPTVYAQVRWTHIEDLLDDVASVLLYSQGIRL